MSTAKLFYTKPASKWTEALPLGNGRIGAMVYGDPVKERLCLNEDTLWTGHPSPPLPSESLRYLEPARRLLAEGRPLEAQSLMEDHLLGREGDAYLPLGDLLLDMDGDGPVEDYRRELELSTGICTVSYRRGDTVFHRELLVSAVHDVLAVRMWTDGPGRLSFRLRMESPLKHTLRAENRRLVLDGLCPSNNAMVYLDEPEERGVGVRAAVQADAADGAVLAGDGELIVQNASSVRLVLSVKTSFNGSDKHPYLEGREYQRACLAVLDRLPAGFEELRRAHAADVSRLFNRVTFSLGRGPADERPTDERLLAFQTNRDDPGLYALLFDYGRYLLVSSSRPGCQPANLQGLWNAAWIAPWKSNYTLNINLEMNYWPALVCRLPELHLPLLQLIAQLEEPGRETARSLYGARGFTAHHNTDLWRKTTPVCGKANHAFWPLAPAWLCLHLYEHYQFTRDRDFLRTQAYPLMRQAALFCLDWLSEDEATGRLRASPATSPENFYLADGQPCAVAASTTMSASLIRNLFENCLEFADLLGIRDDFTAAIRAALPWLPPYRIGSRGQLLEWDEEYEEADPHHRHNSHLVGLHPGADLIRMGDARLIEACRQTLLQRGDEGSGWSLAWRVSLWARLGDGDHALRLLHQQLRPVTAEAIDYAGGGGSYPNLFDAHPPFQIDGNFGVTAGIAEMLLQSHDGGIHLLPALPGAWPDGRITGLAARGGVVVDIAWAGGCLQTARLLSAASQTVTVMYRQRRVAVFLCEGRPLTLNGELLAEDRPERPA